MTFDATIMTQTTVMAQTHKLIMIYAYGNQDQYMLMTPNLSKYDHIHLISFNLSKRDNCYKLKKKRNLLSQNGECMYAHIYILLPLFVIIPKGSHCMRSYQSK